MNLKVFLLEMINIILLLSLMTILTTLLSILREIRMKPLICLNYFLMKLKINLIGRLSVFEVIEALNIILAVLLIFIRLMESFMKEMHHTLLKSMIKLKEKI